MYLEPDVDRGDAYVPAERPEPPAAPAGNWTPGHGNAEPPYPLRVRRPGGLWWALPSGRNRRVAVCAAASPPTRRRRRPFRVAPDPAVVTGTLAEATRHQPVAPRRLLQRLAPLDPAGCFATHCTCHHIRRFDGGFVTSGFAGSTGPCG